MKISLGMAAVESGEWENPPAAGLEECRPQGLRDNIMTSAVFIATKVDDLSQRGWRTPNRPCAAGLCEGESLIEICLEIFDVLNADGKADEVG